MKARPVPWQFWRRAKEGEHCKTKEFEMNRFYKTLRGKIKEYDIKYSPESSMLPTDDLIKAAYDAAMDLLLDVGILCTDTERIIKFEKSEVDQAIKLIPKELVLGSGGDEVRIRARGIEDRAPPVVEGGPIGGPVSEELMEMAPKIYEAYAKEPLVDRQWCHGYGSTYKGMPVESGAPIELEYENAIVNAMVEGIEQAGRPGMPISGSSAVTIEAYMSAKWPKGTQLHSYIMPNMKTDYDSMCRALHCINNDYMVWTGGQAAIGGLAGPAEGCAITTIAENIAGCMLYNGVEGSTFVINAIQTGTTSRKSIWANCLAMSALARHVGMVCRGMPYITHAGPCTEMAFYEIAAATVGGTVSGNNPNMGTGKGGIGVDLFAPLHSRFQAQVARASTSLKREDANQIVEIMLKKYEADLQQKKVPGGKRFQDCYDLKTLAPSNEFNEIYLKIVAELKDLGVPIKDS